MLQKPALGQTDESTLNEVTPLIISCSKDKCTRDGYTGFIQNFDLIVVSLPAESSLFQTTNLGIINQKLWWTQQCQNVVCISCL